MIRYISLALLSFSLSTPAFAIHENNTPQITISGVGLMTDYNALDYQMPISDNGSVVIGYFNGVSDNSYADATAYSFAYKAYFLPGKATFYKMGISYIQDNGSSNSTYRPIMTMGMDLTNPSGPLAVTAELGLSNASGSMFEVNVGLRF
jgi:hypothetical protein